MDRPALPHEVRFGRCALQPHQRRLLVDGQPASLGARAFDLLLALVSQPGQLRTKGELLDEVWPGLVVEEANLSVQISALRKALGGDCIATIPGRGYRFTGVVEVVTPAAPVDEAAGTAAASTREPAAALAGPARPARPSGTSLIGRDRELARLGEDLSSPGCLTLVGPAGVGKTTLARALAAQQAQGAVWADLAPLTTGDQVRAAVSLALGADIVKARDTGLLRAALGARLLVLDNCEHLIDAAAALVADLLQVDPGVRMLATSQRRLAVAGEQVHRLEPLELPLDSDEHGLDRGAVALFVERARAADHRFVPTQAHWPLLRDICRRLDGVPLALEMAAARVPALGLQGLAQALERRLAVLTGGRRDAAARHRTLQAALDWSHDLMSPDEQRLYRLCGVFTGGFSLDLLVAVATGEGHGATTDGADAAQDERRWDVIDTLSQLVDRSLVAVGAGDAPRYRLLETMREDARQRLRTAGEDEDGWARLLTALAGTAGRLLFGAPGVAGLDEVLRAEYDNLREAIAWGRRQAAVDRRADTLTLAVAAARVATFTAWRLEAMQWLESLEPLAESPDMPAEARVRWWGERARQSLMSHGDHAGDLAERALSLAREAGDDSAAFQALSTVVRATGPQRKDELPGLVQEMRTLLQRHPEWTLHNALLLAGVEASVCDVMGDVEGLLRCRLRELDLARRVGHHAFATAVETNIIFALQSLERHEEALLRARELTSRLGDSEGGNAAYAWLGLVISLQVLGRFAEFRAALPRAARVLRRHDLPKLAPPCALVLAAEGRTHEALRLLGHARALFAARGVVMNGDEQSRLDALEDRARAALGAQAVELCLAEGAALDEAAADAIVLGAAPPAGDAAAVVL